MTSNTKISANTLKKIERLVDISEELYKGNSFKITRLTVLKSLSETHAIG